MPITFTFGLSFVNSLAELPKPVYPKLARCLQMLSRNREYPGVNVEKLHGRSNGLSSARVDLGHRLIFEDLPENKVCLLFVGKEEDAYRRAETIKKSVRFCAMRPPIIPRLPAAGGKPSTGIQTDSVGTGPQNMIRLEKTGEQEFTFSEIRKILQSDQERGTSFMVQTKYADQIRQFAYQHYILPTREKKGTSVTIRAGDVAKVLKLQDRIAAVCSALGAKTFQSQYDVKLVERTGPHTSTTTEFKFEV